MSHTSDRDDDKDMNLLKADDSVMECVADGANKVDVFMSYNIADGKNNQRLNELNDKLNLISSRYDSGKLYCKFSRDTVTTVKGKRYDLANDEYYFLLASGTSLKGNYNVCDFLEGRKYIMGLTS